MFISYEETSISLVVVELVTTRRIGPLWLRLVEVSQISLVSDSRQQLSQQSTTTSRRVSVAVIKTERQALTILLIHQ